MYLKTLCSLLLMLLLGGCSSLPDYSDRPLSQSLPPASSGPIADNIMPAIADAETGHSGVFPLLARDDALLARLALIEAARQSIDLQYYIYRDDLSGQLLAAALFRAAERGVRVRILLDDLQRRNDRSLSALNSHPNIEIRLFNPILNRTFRYLYSLINLSKAHRRMHNKSLTVDGRATIVGGRNIGDEYLLSQHEIDFGDLDLLAIGPVVESVARQFDIYWNSPISASVNDLITHAVIRPEALANWLQTLETELEQDGVLNRLNHNSQLAGLASGEIDWYWGKAEVLFDHPNKVYQPDEQESAVLQAISQAMQQSQRQLFIVSPYFVPTQHGTRLLSEIADQGVEVTIVTNSLASNDVFAVHGWYAKYRPELLTNGIQLWEVKVGNPETVTKSLTGSSRTSLHAKTFIVDGQKIFVGSFNLDPRSALINTELGILIESTALAKTAEKQFRDLLQQRAYQLKLDDDGQLIWYDYSQGTTTSCEPDATIWQRLGAWGAGLLPIEELL